MPRKKAPLTKRTAEPKVSDGVFYAILIGLLVTLISGLYYNSTPCISNCLGESIVNGYPYAWFSYNTYEGWQGGTIVWIGGIVNIAFWAFVAYVIMLIFYAAMKEIR